MDTRHVVHNLNKISLTTFNKVLDTRHVVHTSEYNFALIQKVVHYDIAHCYKKWSTIKSNQNSLIPPCISRGLSRGCSTCLRPYHLCSHASGLGCWWSFSLVHVCSNSQSRSSSTTAALGRWSCSATRCTNTWSSLWLCLWIEYVLQLQILFVWMKKKIEW